MSELSNWREDKRAAYLYRVVAGLVRRHGPSRLRAAVFGVNDRLISNATPQRVE